MAVIKNVILFFALTCCIAVLIVDAQSDNKYVTCTYNTPVCTCEVDEPVCNFKLIVRETQTFTKYIVEDVRANGGKVWYIDGETGELEPISDTNDNNPRCPKDDTKMCTDAITADGNTFRTIITVNDQFPGPTLIVHYNQIVSVEVDNRLASEEITIHWHGIHQVNTPWMDGVHHVSQCGIAPGTTFQYIFRAQPAGTHWYHSHTGAQRTDGLFGALIVKETSDTLTSTMSKISPFIDMPESHTLTFLDWQQKNSIELFTQIHSGVRFFTSFAPPDNTMMLKIPTTSTDGGEVGVVTFWSGLINGKGHYPKIPYTKTRLSIFNVEYSKTYRFRIIGAQSLYAFRVSIDDHKLKVIATDGNFVQPKTVDFVIVHSGERYDFLLETKPNSTVLKDFIIRGETLEIQNGTEDHVAEAILHYLPSTQPKSTDYETIVVNSPRKSKECDSTKNCTALNCPFEDYPPSYGIKCISVDTLTLLNPLPADDLPNYEADDEIFLNFGFEGVGNTSAINSRNFDVPSAPLSLLNNGEFMNLFQKEACKQIDDGSKCDTAPNQNVAQECVCVHMRNVAYDQSIQLVFSAIGPDPTAKNSNFLNAHPIHLHGHSFHVVKIGFGTYDDNGLLVNASTDIKCEGMESCTVASWRKSPVQGLVGKIPNNAPLKDTVLLPAGGYVVVYIKSNNPGFWLLHCHIEVHQLEGMVVVINEGFDQHNPSPEGMRQCGDFFWEVEDFYLKERGVVDEITSTPVVVTSSPTGRAPRLYSSFVLVLVSLILILSF